MLSKTTFIATAEAECKPLASFEGQTLAYVGLTQVRRPEADLPELQLAGDAQLLEPRLQVQLQRLRQAQVRPVTLVLPPTPGTDLVSAM